MKACFAAGCFWGIQNEFEKLRGIKSTVAGYMGGKTKNPIYKQVCSGKTRHVETVLVEYNPKEISYEILLKKFWEIHNPFKKVKSQYSSAIFYFSEAQKKSALKSQNQIEEESGKKTATLILPAKTFYRAEEYHQHYYQKTNKCGISFVNK